MSTPGKLLLLTCLAVVAACGPGRRVERLLDAEPLYNQAFTGFSLVDARTGETLAERQSSRLFTPASNTKILTLAAALAWLPADSLPSLTYRADGDTLRLWGLAYPWLAFEGSAAEARLRQRLATWPGPVEISLHGYSQLPRFGEGWMWDDYNDGYQAERSGLPVYANLVEVWRDEDTLRTRPGFLVARPDPVLPKGNLRRAEAANRLQVSSALADGDTLTAPLYGASALALQLLEDWTGRPLRYHDEALPSDWGLRTWRGQTRDSLLRAMMYPSDNFLAEQLLLQAGLVGRDLTDPAAVRRAAQRDVLQLGPDQLRWADGSGLSHYNLVSPVALTTLLVRLAGTQGLPQITDFFPAGGRQGTVSDWYADAGGEPYVFAKTGSLRHNHCLSGYLRARSGRWLAFSFMHNHFVGSSADYKAAMQRTLSAVREAY